MIEARSRERRQGPRVIVAALCLLLGSAAGALGASTDFVEPLSSPETVGVGPVAAAAADLDGDGDRDLAVVSISAGNVTILKNGGTGNFFEPASSPEGGLGSFPDHVVAADIDGDSDQDLMVSNQVSDDVTILKNNGAGNFFQPPSSPEPAGATPTSLAAADLDGDGDPDLAVTNLLTAGTVTILRNNGTGNFVQPLSSPESVGEDPVSVAAADLDGDADRDLAVANQQDASVTILRNNGSANFSEATTSPESTSSFPQGITAADFDADGDRDLAVANQGSDNVTILRNLSAGNFVQPLTSPEPVGDRPLAPPAAADFDGDGDQDLAVANFDSDDVTVLRNSPGNGGLPTGNFVQPVSSPEGAGTGPRGIVAADFDGDGDFDLAVTNQNSSSVTILRNR